MKGEIRLISCDIIMVSERRRSMVESIDADPRDLMTAFTEETGLEPETAAPKRYLWTDAFAVCNFLELFRRTGDGKFRELALRLVEQVHVVLGRHREDDPRDGWISGLGEEKGRQHPTAGGLRIGKTLNERRPGDPFDERLEWERDGQYFHYLTKWMHALDCVARATGEACYSLWALELAQVACAGFIRIPAAADRPRMAWKMSIDLSRPLVPSMGQHDPLDGLLTCRQLRLTDARHFAGAGPDLTEEIEELSGLCRGMDWTTEDFLGIGGLLFDACRTVQLMFAGGGSAELLTTIFDAALAGLTSPALERSLEMPAECRLAFRELGLAIGIEAAARMRERIGKYPERFGRGAAAQIGSLSAHFLVGERITGFWRQSSSRQTGLWGEHREINEVMLATSLAPDGFLSLPGSAEGGTPPLTPPGSD
jgi:hypothetical protein